MHGVWLGSGIYNGPMTGWTERLATTTQRKKLRDDCLDENRRFYGMITCEQCGGVEGEVHDSGKTILAFEVDHKRNISSGVDRAQRYELETNPENHWVLCNPCHHIKTLWEAAEGRKRSSGRSKRKHPGVI